MKFSNLKIIPFTILASLIAILGSGCNGGSSGKIVVITHPSPNPTASSPVYRGPCPAWGCYGPPAPIHTFIPIDPINSPIGIRPTPLSVADSTDADSIDNGTRDTDLQQADLQSATLADRAQTLSTQFQMSISAATQLAVLGDKVQLMTSQGQELSNEDRDAITQSALSIAGITSDEVNQAMSQSISGDNSATDALVTKAAQNLGMPSADNLRGQLLQALGVQLQ